MPEVGSDLRFTSDCGPLEMTSLEPHL